MPYKGRGINVRLPQDSELGLSGTKLTENMLEGILILDEEQELVVFGKKNVLKAVSSVVNMLGGKENIVSFTEGEFFYKVSAKHRAYLSDNGATFIKKHCLVIELPAPVAGRNRLVFWGSKTDLETFLTSISTHRQQHETVQEMLRLCVAEGRATGRLDLADFLRRHPEFVDGDESEAESMETVRTIFQNLIATGELAGVLEGNAYVDRDYIVRQQKTVSVNVQLDFNSLLCQLGQKGISITAVQCPQCKTNCTLPAAGTQFNCEACGALIRVTDVFDKFKAFLG
jgi:hypothetical protein